MPRAIERPAAPVSRETFAAGLASLPMDCANLAGYGALLSDAEVAEDHVQNIFDVDPAKELAERPGREPELLRHDLLAAVMRGLLCVPQCQHRFLQVRALARTRHQRRLGREGPLGELRERVNQFIDLLSRLAR